MKVAVLSESSADEAAIRVLVDAILATESETVNLSMFANRSGWQGRLKAIPVIYRHLYFQTDAEAFAIVLDSDNSTPHDATHDESQADVKDCRLCRTRTLIEQTRQSLSSMPGRATLKSAIGLAVPALEAWLLCGQNSQVGEAMWLVDMARNKFSYTTSKLKELMYGTNRPILAEETEKIVEQAKRIAQRIDDLEKIFPNGFGPFAREIRDW